MNIKYLKITVIWFVCLALVGNLTISAYGRLVRSRSSGVYSNNSSQRLRSLVGKESAELILNLIANGIPEGSKDEVVSFACEILEDAKEEVGKGTLGVEFEDTWVMDESFLVELGIEIEETDIESLVSIPGFNRIYGLLKYSIPALVKKSSIDMATDGFWDFETAFGIFQNKYHDLRAKLITVQNRLTYKKDVVTAGLDIAFKYLFPLSISESSSEQNLARRLEIDNENIDRVAEKEYLYSEWVKRLLPETETKAIADTESFVQSSISVIDDFRERFKTDRNAVIIFKKELSHIVINSKDYLKIRIGNLFLLVEYSLNVSGDKEIDSILVAVPFRASTWKFGHNIDIPNEPSVYIDVNFLNLPNKKKRGFEDKVRDLINKLDLPKMAGNGFLNSNFDFENFKNILETQSHIGKPLFLFLLSRNLKLTLLDVGTYTFTTREHVAFASSENKKIVVGQGREGLKTSNRIAAHEVTHSRFYWLKGNNKLNDKEERVSQAFGQLIGRHGQFFNNIPKNFSYSHLGKLGKLNELIAYMMESLVMGDRKFRSFDKNGERMFEPIFSEDIEILADLGFIPDWARPSELEYKKLTIEEDYYQRLYRRYCKNPELLISELE